MKYLFGGIARAFINLPLIAKVLLVPLLFSGAMLIVTIVGLSQGGTARRAAEMVGRGTLPRIVAVNRSALDLSEVQIDLQRLAVWESNYFDKSAIAKLREQLYAGTARLRFAFTAMHSDADVARLAEAVHSVLRR